MELVPRGSYVDHSAPEGMRCALAIGVLRYLPELGCTPSLHGEFAPVLGHGGHGTGPTVPWHEDFLGSRVIASFTPFSHVVLIHVVLSVITLLVIWSNLPFTRCTECDNPSCDLV